MTGDPRASFSEFAAAGGGRAKPNGQAEPPWRAKCAADEAGHIIRAREWVIEDWIPTGQVCGLYGRGGVAKTGFCLQLMAAASLGVPFAGRVVKQGPTLGLF